MRLRLSAAEAVQTAQHLIFGEAGVPAATAATPLRLAGTSGFTPAAPQQVRGASSRSSRLRAADSCAAGDGGDTTGERSSLCIVCYTSHCHAPASPWRSIRLLRVVGVGRNSYPQRPIFCRSGDMMNFTPAAEA